VTATGDGQDSRGHVAIQEQTGSRTGRTHLLHQRAVTWSVDHGNRDFADRLAKNAGEFADVLTNRLLQADNALADARGDQFVHIENVNRVIHAALIGDRDYRNGVRAAGCCDAGAIDRVDRDIAFWPVAVADAFAVEKHRGFVFFTLADDDGAGEIYG